MTMNQTLTRVLRIGSRGNDVAEIQEALNRLPSAQARLAADGIYGMKTAGRVRELQGQNQLVADGIFGPKSFAMLAKLLGTAMNTPRPFSRAPDPAPAGSR
jgi:peptidoglycan hydrolase-like protein with peptidoglycan-binding domain